MALSQEGERFCARCSQRLGCLEATDEDPLKWPAEENSPRPLLPPLLDDWELDDELRHIERLVGSKAEATAVHQVKRPADEWALDLNNLEIPRATRPATASTNTSDTRRGPSWFAWLVLSLGLSAFLCGSILMGWSHWGGRPDLWNRGLPILLVGQVGLLLGLLFQLERLWRDHRQAVAKLDQFDLQLSDLNQTAFELKHSHSSASQAFYAHLASGASPKVLLSDLKSQLDLLAARMSEGSGSKL